MQIFNKGFISLYFLLLFTLHAKAFQTCEFGKSYNEFLTTIKSELGEPNVVASDTLIYKNATYYGFKWNEIIFAFRDGMLTEARCYMNQKSKAAASKIIKDVAKAMEQDHVMTMDFEDDGTLFYAGGKSPEGFGHLFTLFLSPRKGVWTTQLRFGPFRKIE